MRGEGLACGEEGEGAESAEGRLFKKCAMDSCFFPSDSFPKAEARGMG